MRTQSPKPKVFFCYARADKELRDELEAHLSSLKRSQRITTWSDLELVPGSEWKSVIHEHLMCELLAYLSRRIYGQPIIIVATCRDHDLPDGHPLNPLLTDLLRERAVETISLHSLSNEQISTLISHSLHVEQVPEPLIERIRTRAAGNPFFAEELARTIGIQLSTQEADGTHGHYTNSHNPTNGHTPATLSMGMNATVESVLPDTISTVLDLRLSRLSAACVRLLTKAAVLGGSFEFRVITEMEANVPGSDEDVVKLCSS